MHEATTHAATRDAILNAHNERARVISSVWGWLFAPTSR